MIGSGRSRRPRALGGERAGNLASQLSIFPKFAAGAGADAAAGAAAGAGAVAGAGAAAGAGAGAGGGGGGGGWCAVDGGAGKNNGLWRRV